MARAERRSGFGVNKGSLNPKTTVSETAPVSPSHKDNWIDIVNALHYFYDATLAEWVLIGGIAVSTTEPETGYDGQMLLKDKIGYPVSCIFSSYSTKTANTAAEVTIVPVSFTGVQTLPADFLTVGKMLRIKLCGYLKGSASETLNIIFKLGTTAICATGATTTVNASNKFFEIEIILTCITIGATGTVWAQGRFLHNSVVWEMVNTATDTINTTATQLINATATFSDVTNTPFVTVTNMTVELMYGDYRDDGWVYGVPMYYITPPPPPETEPEFSSSYIFGGFSSANISDCDQYTPDTWTSKTDIPSPARREFTATDIGSSGYVFSGFASAEISDCDQYTPDTWTSKTDMPSPARQLASSTRIGSNGYVFGGEVNTAEISDCDQYTPDTWTSKTDMSSPARQGHVAIRIGSSGYIFGGTSNSSNISDCDQYTPDTWTSKTDMTSPARKLASATNIGSSGYIFGGFASTNVAYCDQYTPDTWTSKTDMPSPVRILTSATRIGSSGYIFGGFSSVNLSDCDQYTPDTWTSKTDMPSPKRWGSSANSL